MAEPGSMRFPSALRFRRLRGWTGVFSVLMFVVSVLRVATAARPLAAFAETLVGTAFFALVVSFVKRRRSRRLNQLA